MTLPMLTDLLEQKRAEVAAIERVIALLGILPPDSRTGTAFDPNPKAGAALAHRRGRRGLKAPGRVNRPEPTPDAGLQADVLSALRSFKGPARAKDLIAKCAPLKPERVMLTLRALVARKEVIKTGATISLRYCAPEFAARDDA